MVNAQNEKLLDFLAEGFLRRNSWVTYTTFSGIPALQVSVEDTPPRIYITAVEEVSKMSFLKQFPSEEICVPVLKSEEEKSLKEILAKTEITTIKVYRLSIPQRYSWYMREFIEQNY